MRVGALGDDGWGHAGPILFAVMAVALVGCSSPATPGDGDTVPSFTGLVADQTYTSGEAINTLDAAGGPATARNLVLLSEAPGGSSGFVSSDQRGQFS